MAILELQILLIIVELTCICSDFTTEKLIVQNIQ